MARVLINSVRANFTSYSSNCSSVQDFEDLVDILIKQFELKTRY